MTHCMRVPLILFMLLLQLRRVANIKCPEAVKSVVRVESCPITKQDWEIAAKLKKCNEAAAQQNCSDADQFVYHCVINGFQNDTLEVCAPQRFIIGFCTEFNVAGEVITTHKYAPCNKKNFPNCSEIYPSSEAYKYQGCYELVYSKKRMHSAINPTNKPSTSYESENDTRVKSSTAIPKDKTPDDPENKDTTTIIAVVSVFALVVCIAIVIFFFNKKRKTRKSNDTSVDKEEQNSLIPKPVDNEQGPLRESTAMDDIKERKRANPKDPETVTGADKNTSSLEKTAEDLCKENKACAAGKLLLDMVRENVPDTKMNDRRKENEVETNAFLEAYNEVNESFVETDLTYKCINQLEHTGLVVLIGKQGCGKTLTAVHIMKSSSYEGWVKRKFKSWEDLLVFDLKENTVVYIDNIFDGYIYQYQLKKWWDALCYFYFNFIKDKDSVRLLITAKDKVIENACAHVRANVPLLKTFFFVEEESFPLSVSKMLDIVNMQVKLAEMMKNIPKPTFTDTLVTPIRTGDIGFPLCAHLYAFEERPNEKGVWILDNPRAYVKNQIDYEIKKDKTNGVKTLFLILLLYHTKPGSYNKMDFRYGEDWLVFLKERCSEALIEDMKPLNFEDLNEKATELKDKILVKHHSMYEFKHQIYLEGLTDYFLREHFEVAVQHFPLYILRTCEFQTIAERRLIILVSRLIQELFKSALSEALSCRIFERDEFEQRFCNELQKEEKLKELIYIPDKASPFSLPIIFWANKYGLKRLSKCLWHFVDTIKEDVHFQFYLARFGECCENNENYITRISTPLNVNDVRISVCHFRFAGKKNILHLLISSDKSDNDAHRFMMKIINDSPNERVAADMDLLTCALTHVKNSRLLCIIEILFQLNEGSTKHEQLSGSCLVEPLNKHPNDTFWELELGVRICIVLAYNKIHSLTECVETTFVKKNRQIGQLFQGGKIAQTEMAQYIKMLFKKCNKSIPSSSDKTLDDIKVRFGSLICRELLNGIKSSILLQSMKDDFF